VARLGASASTWLLFMGVLTTLRHPILALDIWVAPSTRL